MANLSICLRYYIADRLNNDPGWKNIKVGICTCTNVDSILEIHETIGQFRVTLCLCFKISLCAKPVI